jgi:20S proteasome alpha/beta subunit
MTFVVGFRCANGVVLCTDSLEADGVTKRHIDKTRVITAPDWGVAISGAGPGGLIDKFTSEVSSSLQHGTYDPKLIESTIEYTLTNFRSQYQEPFRVLVGVYCPRLNTYALYRSDDNYLAPISDHAHIGMGHSLWRFFVENLHVIGNSVDDNSRLALFIMRQAINYVDGVGGPIRLVSFTRGDHVWKVIKGPFFLSLERFESGYRGLDVGTVLKDSWKLHTPPSRAEQVAKFGSVEDIGDELTFLDGVKLERLGSVAGRKKASNSFWCNRDRLRKRGMLERGRDLAKKASDQQP